MARKQFKRTLAVGSGGDFDLDGSGKMYFIDGPAGVEQELKARLLTVRGEDPFDPDFGLPIFEITGAPDPVVRRIIRRELNKDDRVNAVPAVEISREDDDTPRDLAIEVEVELVDGTPLEITTGINS